MTRQDWEQFKDASPPQQAYATSAQAAGFPYGAPGTASNPVYATPDRPIPADMSGVNLQGQYQPGAGQDDGWRGFRDDPNSAPMPVYEDMGRSAVTGVEKGIASILGIVGDAQNLEGNAVENAEAWALGKLGLVDDPAKFRAALSGGGGLDDFAAMNGAATSAQTNRAMQMALGPYHQPQSLGGRWAETAGQLAPGALLGGGGVGATLANTLVPATLGQAAYEVAPDPYKGAARMVGELGGFGISGAGRALANAPARVAGQAISSATPEQLQAAANLYTRSRLPGAVPLTTGEALAQVGGGTGLTRLQHFVENTPQTADRMQAFMMQRPDAVRSAVTGYADQIAPPTNQPSMVGVRGQDAATAGLDRARQAVNAAAAPDYAALRSQAMDPSEYEALAASPSYRAALANLRTQPELNGPVADLPDNNLAVVNEVQKRLGAMGEQAKGTPLSPGDNHLAAIRFEQQGLADEAARNASAPYGGQYGAARDTVRDLSQAFVDPLRAGPLGEVSATPAVRGQTGALFPQKPLEGQSAETSTAMRVLGTQDAQLPADLTRQYLVNALNDATKAAGRGAEGQQFVGARYAHDLAGNPEAGAALDANLRTLPAGDQRAQEMAALLENLQATGTRMPAGSRTAFNQQMADALRSPGIGVGAITSALDPLEIGRHVNNAVGGMLYRSRLSGLADLLLPENETAAAAFARSREANRGLARLLEARP